GSLRPGPVHVAVDARQDAPWRLILCSGTELHDGPGEQAVDEQRIVANDVFPAPNSTLAGDPDLGLRHEHGSCGAGGEQGGETDPHQQRGLHRPAPFPSSRGGWTARQAARTTRTRERPASANSDARPGSTSPRGETSEEG